MWDPTYGVGIVRLIVRDLKLRLKENYFARDLFVEWDQRNRITYVKSGCGIRLRGKKVN